ncbi:protein CDC73 homolog isoform X2 [Cryptomeria japonica]|uniref:protein CDC73 homolog isoform X2 n=1 Tax=Cryptomeria japonica TaxID=3369 RepID=UPI0025AB7366|nr:protein CDC73 homolog isoform X2 [Cryptomeria japonica]
MDPLSVLRDYTIRGDLDNVKAVGDDFHFGEDYRFPCNIDTAYRSKQGSLYTLECLVFFVKNAHLKHTEYMQQARVQKLQIVTYTDRKPLLDYLEGKINTTDAIELVAPAGPHVPPEKPIWDAGDHVEEYRPEDPSLGFFDNGNNSNKRIRIDGTEGGDIGGAETDQVAVTETGPLIDLVRAKERPLKDREALLECPNRNFQAVLSMATRRDEERRKSEDLQRKQQGRPMETPRKNHYGITEEKRFWKDHLGTDTDELGIDPTQSYIGQKGFAKPGLVSQRPQVQGTPRSSFGSGGGKGKPDGVPIILVPSAFQTRMNIYNAKDFLEDGVYVAPDVKAKQMPQKPECVTIQRKIGREKTPVAYQIRDKPSALAANDWDRVVALFVLGKEWQFKDFPFKDHVEIFNKNQQTQATPG